MVTRQAVLHFLGPTLHVLSFISQAHYLDRVVKGMVFLYFPVVFVSVFVCERKSHVHIRMYITHHWHDGVYMLQHPQLCHSRKVGFGDGECRSLPQSHRAVCDITIVLRPFHHPCTPPPDLPPHPPHLMSPHPFLMASGPSESRH